MISPSFLEACFSSPSVAVGEYQTMFIHIHASLRGISCNLVDAMILLRSCANTGHKKYMESAPGS